MKEAERVDVLCCDPRRRCPVPSLPPWRVLCLSPMTKGQLKRLFLLSSRAYEASLSQDRRLSYRHHMRLDDSAVCCCSVQGVFLKLKVELSKMKKMASVKSCDLVAAWIQLEMV